MCKKVEVVKNARYIKSGTLLAHNKKGPLSGAFFSRRILFFQLDQADVYCSLIAVRLLPFAQQDNYVYQLCPRELSA
jgi:hypothetical protein